jgi:hypothetical protein
MITPTVGRVIWIRQRTHALRGSQPEAALVAFVNEDGTINVGGTNHHGLPFALNSVKILAEGETPPTDGVYAEWMPFQLGQAKAQAAAPKPDGDID